MRTLLAALLVLTVAGCGRYGGLRSEPGSTYPLAYPSPDLAGASGPSPAAAAAAASATKDKQFSSGGAYIDPSVRAPVIYGSVVVEGVQPAPTAGISNPAPTPGTSGNAAAAVPTP